MVRKKINNYNIQIITIILFIISVVILIIFAFLKGDSEEDRINEFIISLSDAYNAKVLFQHYETDDLTLKKKFPLYTSETDTLQVIVASQTLEDAVKNGGFLIGNDNRYAYDKNEELFTVFFKRIEGNSPVIIYDSKLKVDDVINKLGYIGMYGKQHTMLFATDYNSPNDSRFYPIIIGFPRSEVLNNSAVNGKKAGEGIYAFQNEGNQEYILINMEYTSLTTENVKPVQDNFVQLIKKKLRGSRLYKLFIYNQDLYNFFSWMFFCLLGVLNLVFYFRIKQNKNNPKKKDIKHVKKSK